MFLSTRSRYGLRALIDLSAHYTGKPVLLRDIAQRENLSVRYLENIFSKLKTAGIIKSSRGKGGGFYPARDLNDIRLIDIVDVLEGNTSVSACVDIPACCKRSDMCVAREVWFSLNENLRKFLATITIDGLVEKYNKMMVTPLEKS